ncbi:MAG: carbohydrate kinase family protein [Inquilinaceae bacterium]
MVPDLVTIGGLTVDNVVAADGTVALNQAGGNGAYSAVGALMWCDRVGLVSQAVASYPRDVIQRLEAGGLDLAGVVWTPARLTSCNWFIYDADGRRDEGLQSNPEDLAAAGFPTDRLSPDQVQQWRARLARRSVPGEISYSQFRVANPLRPDQVPERFRQARGVHLAPSQPDVMLAMAKLFADGEGTVIGDPGWQLAEHRLDAIAPILARLDAFLPSEVELRAFVPGAAPADGLAVLAERCPGHVAVKLGPRGVLVWDRAQGHPVLVPAAPAATLDPTGAGDAFCGGFLAGLVETGDPVKAARFGAVSAGRTVERFGADGAMPPDRAAARAALASLCRTETISG